MRGAMLGVCLLSLAGLATIGCQQQTETAATMKPAERPVELDRLDVWAGRWETTSETRLVGSDEVKTTTATDTWRWACDRRVLVNEWKGTTEDRKTEGIGLWTWDPQSKKYTVWQINSSGAVATGTMTYDEQANTWHIKGKSQAPETGKSTVFEATATMPDANTAKFAGTLWQDAWKLKERGEFNATLKRK